VSHSDREPPPGKGKSGQYSLASGGAISLASQAFRSALKMAAQIVIARFLVPSDYGLVALMAPVLALAQLLSDFGLGQTIIQSREISSNEISVLFWLSMALNVCLSAVLMATVPLLVWLYHEPRLMTLGVTLAFLVPIAGLATIPVSLLIKNLRLVPLAGFDVVPPLVALVAGTIAAASGLTYWAIVVSLFADSITGAVIAWCLCGWFPSRPRREGLSWRLVKVGGHLTGVNAANFLTSTVDNVLLSIAWGATALGLYDKGYKIVTQPAGQLLYPISRLALPLLVRTADDKDRYRQEFCHILRLVMILMYPGLVFIAVMAKPLVSLLLGANWLSIAPVISWLSIGCFSLPIYTSTNWIFMSQQRSGEQLRYSVATSVVSIAGFVIGLPWGPVGVAAAAGLTYSVLATPLTCWGATRSGFVALRDLATVVVPSLAAAIPTAVILLLLDDHLPDGLLARLLVGVLAAYVCFFVFICAFPPERRLFQAVLRRQTHVVQRLVRTRFSQRWLGHNSDRRASKNPVP
jgi:polysaccharide transporter, PST family